MSENYIKKLILFAVLCFIATIIIVPLYGKNGVPWYISVVTGVGCMIISNLIMKDKK
ncbi:MAG: hypothetical protein ACW98X_26560 [Promethearchaeota archaeon]|jgi:hypothetical protein